MMSNDDRLRIYLSCPPIFHVVHNNDGDDHDVMMMVMMMLMKIFTSYLLFAFR